MPKLDFEKEVRFSAGQMFDLVADLQTYPDFIPNCSAMAVTPGDRPNIKQARMSIRFGPISQSYTSVVTLDGEAHTIAAHAIDGPFSHLDSLWRFTEIPGGTHIHFAIDFAISNPLIRIAAEPAFASKQREILQAFITEAGRRYA